MTDMFLGSHQGAWALLLISFIVAFALYKARKTTGGKVVAMITRLFYLIMVISGAGLLFQYGFPTHYLVKGIIALIMIGFMEMAMGKAKREQTGWTGFIIALVLALLVVIMGFAG